MIMFTYELNDCIALKLKVPGVQGGSYVSGVQKNCAQLGICRDRTT